MAATSSPEASSTTSDGAVLITGVTGMVGRALAARLGETGRRVVGVSRSLGSARAAMPEGSRAHVWASADARLDPAALEGVSAVVHLAGEPVSGRWTKAKRKRIENSRVEGTRRVVEAMAAARSAPKVLVSAMGFYGDRGDDWLDEDEPAGDDFLARVCSGWEREAAAAEASGARVAMLRISLVLGDGGVLGALRPLFKAGLGGPIGSGDQQWSWVHIDDLVSLIVLALGEPEITGPLNAATDALTQREFAKTLGRVLSRPAIVPTPTFAVRAAMSGFADELVNSRRLTSKRARAAGWQPRHELLEGALRQCMDSR